MDVYVKPSLIIQKKINGSFVQLNAICIRFDAEINCFLQK